MVGLKDVESHVKELNMVVHALTKVGFKLWVFMYQSHEKSTKFICVDKNGTIDKQKLPGKTKWHILVQDQENKDSHLNLKDLQVQVHNDKQERQILILNFYKHRLDMQIMQNNIKD